MSRPLIAILRGIAPEEAVHGAGRSQYGLSGD